jgi:hypothetical protein
VKKRKKKLKSDEKKLMENLSKDFYPIGEIIFLFFLLLAEIPSQPSPQFFSQVIISILPCKEAEHL